MNIKIVLSYTILKSSFLKHIFFRPPLPQLEHSMWPQVKEITTQTFSRETVGFFLFVHANQYYVLSISESFLKDSQTSCYSVNVRDKITARQTDFSLLKLSKFGRRRLNTIYKPRQPGHPPSTKYWNAVLCPTYVSL